MKPRQFVLLVACVLGIGLGSCDRAQPSVPETTVPEVVEPAPTPPGATGDNIGLALADRVIKAHGGREAYDSTRYFKWDFFGFRTLWWDKEEQLARIEVPGENTIYLVDYSGDRPTGRVSIDGREVTDPGRLDSLLDGAKSIWINDSYWLVQQFKLKDPGVILTHAGEISQDPLKKQPSYLLDVTFEGVGDTPGNRYRLYVDKQSNRVNTWQFFREAEGREPDMQTPWDGYAEHRGLLLSTDRGGRFQLGNVKLPNAMSSATFEEF